jgi:acyl-CoA reductase-like NAD-dependent aldehyde dehydrogenase
MATIPTHLEFDHLMAQAKQIAPEAFDERGRLFALTAGDVLLPASWITPISPIDGRELAEFPVLETPQARYAVEAASREFASWAGLSLEERKHDVAACAEMLRTHRTLLASLLMWEIGKTMAAAYSDVDRCVEGVEWYVGEIDRMMHGRRPLGLVSNVASWNYPFSVLATNILVQALAGNAVVAKIPTRGGGIALSVALALFRRQGLPATLIGGRGKDLTEPLVGHHAVAGVAFVGGRSSGAKVGERLQDSGKRYALEMEGVNAYAITGFSDWDALAKQIKAGFDYGKQRCTAYTRWVVDRALVPQFLDTYTSQAGQLRVGNPMSDLPLDFGPLIAADKVEELHAQIHEAKAQGADVLFQGQLVEESFFPDQDLRAYFAPTLLAKVPYGSDLYRREPFAPVDLLIAVDSEDQMVAEANVSDGALVASVACDDPGRAERIAERLQAYKTGINRLRSRGDKEETFGGAGLSWKGAYVGGSLLVRTFTDGVEPLEGNWH